MTEISNVRDHREQLGHSLEDSAEWSAGKAEELPNDERTGRSAAALGVAARDVAGLPHNDPRLRRLVRLYEAGDDAGGDFLEGDSIIARHRFLPMPRRRAMSCCPLCRERQRRRDLVAGRRAVGAGRRLGGRRLPALT
jgi:hypothetical protein